MTNLTNFNPEDYEKLIARWVKAEKEGELYPVEFDLAWKIAGYSRRDSAKRTLVDKGYFTEGDDFFIEKGTILHNSVESAAVGRSSDLIMLSCDAFKEFCMVSKTVTGKATRKYFIESEKKWRLTQEHYPEIAVDVEGLRLEQLIRLEEMRLKNEQSRYDNNRLTMDMATMHGKEFALAAIGQGGQIVEVEKPIIEVLDKSCGDKRRGMTAVQMNTYLKQKTGNGFKSGAALVRELNKLAPDLVDLVQRPINQEFIHEDNIEAAFKILSRGEQKQLRIGEV
jgi:phage anti-repressor protein